MRNWEQGELELDPGRDLVDDPVTVDEVLSIIDKRVQARLRCTPRASIRPSPNRSNWLRQQAITCAEDSVESLKKALELAARWSKPTVLRRLRRPTKPKHC